MTREEAIKEYIMPALKRTWSDDTCIEIISAIEQDPYEVVLNNIRAEINGLYRVVLKDTPKDDWTVRWNDCIDEVLQIIDKYKGGK